MGNYKFRLSDMIPNAWFYKLKDMGKGRKPCPSSSFKKNPPLTASQKPNFSHPRYTYYLSTDSSKADKYYTSSLTRRSAVESPRKLSKRRSKRKTIYKPSPKLTSPSLLADDCPSCRNKISNRSVVDQALHSPDYSTFESSSSDLDFQKSHAYESEEEDDDHEEDGLTPSYSPNQQLGSFSSSCNCNVTTTTDIIIDVNGESFKRDNEKICQVHLPPILTKPTNFPEMARAKFRTRSSNSCSPLSTKEGRRVTTHKDQKNSDSVQRRPSNSAGIRLRTNSPKIGSRKIQGLSVRKSMSRNKSLSESFAVVKSSTDPQQDFKDSMAEMIIENNIRTLKDLEDLLACYLSLNSKEYHNVIVKAFEQIWFDMTRLRL